MGEALTTKCVFALVAVDLAVMLVEVDIQLCIRRTLPYSGRQQNAGDFCSAGRSYRFSFAMKLRLVAVGASSGRLRHTWIMEEVMALVPIPTDLCVCSVHIVHVENMIYLLVNSFEVSA